MEDSSKKIAVKLTVKQVPSGNLKFDRGFANLGSESIPELVVENLDPEIEISAPFSRLENPNTSTENSSTGNKEAENDKPYKDAKDSEKINQNSSKPNKEPKPTAPNKKDKPEKNDKPNHQNPNQFTEEIEAEINRRNAEKEAQIKRVLEDFKQAQDLAEKLKKLQEATKNIEDQSYWNNQEAIEEAEKEVVTIDSVQATQTFLAILNQQMEDNGITSPTELGSEIAAQYEKLWGGTIVEPDLIVQIKHQVSAKIGEIGASERFNELSDKVENVLRTGQKIEQVRTELANFLKSTNIYDQALIIQRQEKFLELKNALDNFSNNNQQPISNPINFPWKIVLPIVLVGIVLLVGLVVILRKKRQKN